MVDSAFDGTFSNRTKKSDLTRDNPGTLPLNEDVPDKDAEFSTTKNRSQEESILEGETNRSDIIRRLNSANISHFEVENESNVTNYLSLFTSALNRLQRVLHLSIFKRLSSIGPVDRKENGVSFTHSSIFLLINLMGLTNEVDSQTRAEIINTIGFNTSYKEYLIIIKEVLFALPTTDKDLRFPWISRLITSPKTILSRNFQNQVAPLMQLHVKKLDGHESIENLTMGLNDMIFEDSTGTMHDTIDEEDLSDGVRAILLTTMCLRPTWLSAPTLLNDTWPFLDHPEAPKRAARMIRINDVMKYADLCDLDAEAVEISYTTPGLSILIIIPRSNLLRQLVENLATTDIDLVLQKMQTLRVAVTLPIFTLRMTLLLPNKLKDLGISHLVDWNDTSDEAVRISHAIQRLMFWSEPGRHAYKDDGIEWDETPKIELKVNRPYIFYVRWQNLTLLQGNFVL